MNNVTNKIMDQPRSLTREEIKYIIRQVSDRSVMAHTSMFDYLETFLLPTYVVVPSEIPTIINHLIRWCSEQGYKLHDHRG